MRALATGLAILAGTAAPALAADGFRMLSPPAESIIGGAGIVHVIVELDAGTETNNAHARLRDVDLGPGKAKARAAGTTVVHWTVRLNPGPNAIEVVLGDPAAPRAGERRVVFYHEPILSNEEPPPTFKTIPFHRERRDVVCRECHALDAVPTDAMPGAPERSTCHACHAPITDVRRVHGPAALWACTKCHEPSTSYATPKPVMPLCFGCHQEQKDRFWGNPYRHGPTATGFCTICHNPHGSENDFFTKKATWFLCTTCHWEKGSGRHVVSWGPTGQSHPTRGRPDPSRAGKELSCASCHNPHAAPGVRLWNFGAVRWLDLCKNCHQAVFGAQ